MSEPQRFQMALCVDGPWAGMTRNVVDETVDVVLLDDGSVVRAVETTIDEIDSARVRSRFTYRTDELLLGTRIFRVAFCTGDMTSPASLNAAIDALIDSSDSFIVQVGRVTRL
jgi:hypothetical protein